MNITKYAHSCLLIEVGSVRILTDLGSWNRTPDESELSAILITHEHTDHFDISKLKEILAKNPEAEVITHAAVGEKLAAEGIAYTAIEPGERIDVYGVPIESYGTDHAIMYGAMSPCRNTGYLIDERLFMPGDALHDIPPKPVEILALPTGGPWLKISEVIDYAKAVHPKIVFPIHDAMYTSSYRAEGIPRFIGTALEADGIHFVNLMENSSEVFE